MTELRRPFLAFSRPYTDHIALIIGSVDQLRNMRTHTNRIVPDMIACFHYPSAVVRPRGLESQLFGLSDENKAVH